MWVRLHQCTTWSGFVPQRVRSDWWTWRRIRIWSSDRIGCIWSRVKKMSNFLIKSWSWGNLHWVQKTDFSHGSMTREWFWISVNSDYRGGEWLYRVKDEINSAKWMRTCDDGLLGQCVISAVARLFQLQTFIVHPIGPVDGTGCASLVAGHVEKSVLRFDCLRMTCEAVTWRNKGKEVACWENIQGRSLNEIVIIAQWSIEIPFWWVVRWSRRSDTISS